MEGFAAMTVFFKYFRQSNLKDEMIEGTNKGVNHGNDRVNLHFDPVNSENDPVNMENDPINKIFEYVILIKNW